MRGLCSILLRVVLVAAAGLGVFLPVLSASSQAPAAQPLDLETLLVPPNDRFGLNRASFGADGPDGYRHELAGEAGAAWNRWPLYWYAVESENGFDYSLYDRAVAGDLLRGTKVDVVILGTPEIHASASEHHQSTTPKNLDLPIFEDGTDSFAPGKRVNPDNYWARFVNQTVERYKPDGELRRQGAIPAGVGVRHWEIWNEPDVDFYWSGRGPGTEVDDYLRLLKVASLAARAADPEAKIVIGGLGYWGREGWIEDLFRQIRTDPNASDNRDYFDVMAWHVYSRAVDLYNRASWSRHLLHDFGFANKEVWINEANIPVWGDPTPDHRDPGTHRGSPQEQAAFILQGYAYAFAGGADKVFTFMLYDDCWQFGEHYGLVRNPPGDYPISDCASDGKPRPAYGAYKIAASLFRDIKKSSITSYGPGGAVDVVTLETGNGARVSVITNKFGSPEAVDIPVRGRAVLIGQDGDVMNVWTGGGDSYRVYAPAASANDAELGDDPYFIVGGRTQVLLELPPDKSGSGVFVNEGFEMPLAFAGWWTRGAEPALVNLAWSGGRAAMLRTGGNGTSTSRLEQTLRLPPRSNPEMSFRYAVATTQPLDDGQPSAFEVAVRSGNGPEMVLWRQSTASGWTEKRIDLTRFGGQLVTFTFTARGSRYPLAAYVDDVVLWPYRIRMPVIHKEDQR